MASICLSTAAILRCESYTRVQNIVLVIPTALEVIFSSALIFTNWDKGLRHLWLTAEGWLYFVLVILEMISHIFPAVRNDPAVLKIFDRVLAATSAIPILFYSLFIFLLMRAELVDNLPRRLQTPTKLLLFLFIPVTTAMNELASFIGISYRDILFRERFFVVVGFDDDGDRILWVFFMSFSLALLTAYQFINAFLAFYRVVRALINQRRIETSSSEEIQFFRGIVWIACALALGGIETVIGFAGGGFGGALTRRVFRFFARSFLVVGVAKGVDSIEDFELVHQEMLRPAKPPEFRRSKLREFISNPRFSSFRQLTPTATAFHSAPRAPLNLPRFYTRTGSPSISSVESEGSPVREKEPKTPTSRVTIDFVNGTPCLKVRFSDLIIPPPLPPPVFIETPPTRRLSLAAMESPTHLNPFPATPQRLSLLSSLVMTDAGDEVKLRGFSSPPSKAPSRVNSTRGFADSTLSPTAMAELASQFPPLPANARAKIQSLPAKGKDFEKDFWDDSASVVSPDVIEHKVAEQSMPSFIHFQNSRSPSRSGPPTAVSDKATYPHIVVTTARSSRQNRQALSIPTIGPRWQPAHVPMSALSPKAPSDIPAVNVDQPSPADDVEDPFANALETGKSREFMQSGSEPSPQYEERATHRSTMLSAIEERLYDESEREMSFKALSPLETPRTAEVPRRKQSSPRVVEERRRARRSGPNSPPSTSTSSTPSARIMAVGSAPRRYTPIPTRRSYSRGSLYIEPIIIPPKQDMNTEIIQESYNSFSGRNVLRDSEVLGIEDGSFYRELRERRRA